MEKHVMRCTPYKGLAAVSAWVKLKFAALNLKKLAIHKGRACSFLQMLEDTSFDREFTFLTNGDHPHHHGWSLLAPSSAAGMVVPLHTSVGVVM